MEITFDENGTVDSRMNKRMKFEHDPVEHVIRGFDVSSLPEELMLEIVSNLIVLELRENAVAKFQSEPQLVDQISQRLQELKSVCRKWSSFISNSPTFLQRKILYQLRFSGVIPLVIRSHNFLTIVVKIAKLWEKIYTIRCPSDPLRKNTDPVELHVYGDDFGFQMSVDLKHLKCTSTLLACHGFLNILTKEGVWRISPEDDFKQELWLNRKSLGMEDTLQWPEISVSNDNNLLMYNHHKFMIAIYGSSGDILRSIKVQNCFLECERPFRITEKINGNLAFWMYRYIKDKSKRMLEFNSDGNVLRNIYLYGDAYDGRSLLESSDKLIAIDKFWRSVYLLDSDLQVCHSVSLDGRENLPILHRALTVSDLHYDADRNILYLAFCDFSSWIKSNSNCLDI